MKHLWMTDCQSLHDHLTNPVLTKVSDKRLSIDLTAMRQILWELEDGELRDELGKQDPDQLRWIDTSTMLCDCLTKDMHADQLRQAIQTNVIDLQASDHSIMSKMMKQKQRRKKKANDDPAEDIGTGVDKSHKDVDDGDGGQ